MLLSVYPIFGSFGKPVSRRNVFSVLLLEDDFDLLPLEEVFLLDDVFLLLVCLYGAAQLND